jgi:sialate O-acetylesterase
LPAKALIYGQKNLEYSGPAYKSAKIKDNKIIITFDHTGSGMIAKGDTLKGFVIAGKDNNWMIANAIINRNKIEVSHSSITHPLKFVTHGLTGQMEICIIKKICPHLLLKQI